MIPPEVIQIRRELCKCEGVNHADPCAACPNGHFGRYEQTGCEDPARVIPAEPPRPAPIIPKKPGDILEIVIREITGIQATNSCACNARKAEMNRGGWAWCWRNRAKIVGWLVEEAARLGYPVAGKTVTGLVRVALRLRRRP